MRSSLGGGATRSEEAEAERWRQRRRWCTRALGGSAGSGRGEGAVGGATADGRVEAAVRWRGHRADGSAASWGDGGPMVRLLLLLAFCFGLLFLCRRHRVFV